MLALYEGHSRDEWGRLANLLALIANCHRDPKKRRAITAAEMNPHLRRGGGGCRGIRLRKETIGVLKVFLPKRKRLGHDGQ